MENLGNEDEMLIREIFNKSVTAWNTRNIDLFSTLYTPDVNYITFMGEYIKGLDANLKVHRDLWNSYFMKGAVMEGQIASIKFSSNISAVMIAEGAVKLRFQKKTPVNRKSVNTSVLIKQNGEWKICSFQNTRIRGYGIFTRFMMWIDKKITK